MTAAGVFWFAGDPRWQAPADITPLTETVEADVCVVGGGYTGLWAALHTKWLAPRTEVVLVEREFCGAGAAGRNGGWVNGFEGYLPGFIERFGEEAAVWLVEESLRGVDAMADVVRQHAIDCDLALNGGVSVATCAAHVGHWDAQLAAIERTGLGGLYRKLDAAEARELSGCAGALEGVVRVRAGSVQPALLALGLRRVALAAGVRIFEASPMTAFSRRRPSVVETTGGTVVADRVVLGLASWLATVAELRRTLFIIPSHMIATEPSAERLDAVGWKDGRPFSDARTTVHYGQRTHDDRMAIGRGGGRLGFAGRVIPAHFHDEREAREITEDMYALMPAMRGARVDWRWGGPVDRAQHGYPWVGTIGRERNIHYGAGYSGNGVGPSYFIGRTLASLALDAQDEFARSPLVSDPPSYLPIEPVRFVGARTVRTAIKRCEDAETGDRQPDPVSRQLRKALNIQLPRGVELWRLRR
jgi:glycine/D-amino acid oxidase-like deaminating enzyme